MAFPFATPHHARTCRPDGLSSLDGDGHALLRLVLQLGKVVIVYVTLKKALALTLKMLSNATWDHSQRGP